MKKRIILLAFFVPLVSSCDGETNFCYRIRKYQDEDMLCRVAISNFTQTATISCVRKELKNDE